jgi:hypothetical protein
MQEMNFLNVCIKYRLQNFNFCKNYGLYTQSVDKMTYILHTLSISTYRMSYERAEKFFMYIIQNCDFIGQIKNKMKFPYDPG